jgi:hypothetical protein
LPKIRDFDEKSKSMLPVNDLLKRLDVAIPEKGDVEL